MFEYDYIETDAALGGGNRLYQLAPDLVHWATVELEKRRFELTSEMGGMIRICLTQRSFRNWPVFLFCRMQEESCKVLEAWYFHMTPPADDKVSALQLVLDRVSLRLFFADDPSWIAEVKTAAAGPLPPGAKPARSKRVRPQPKPEGF